MNELEMIKAFAELEGISFIEFGGDLLPTTGARILNGKYNPITDPALNCKARDDYEVGIDYHVGSCIVIHGEEYKEVCFESKEDIPRAVIECILKSKGLHHEKP